MPEWTQGTVSANGLEVYYRRTGAGSGKPPLVLLHGYVDSGKCWTATAGALEDTFDLIERGHFTNHGAGAQRRDAHITSTLGRNAHLHLAFKDDGERIAHNALGEETRTRLKRKLRASRRQARVRLRAHALEEARLAKRGLHRREIASRARRHARALPLPSRIFYSPMGRRLKQVSTLAMHGEDR